MFNYKKETILRMVPLEINGSLEKLCFPLCLEGSFKTPLYAATAFVEKSCAHRSFPTLMGIYSFVKVSPSMYKIS